MLSRTLRTVSAIGLLALTARGLDTGAEAVALSIGALLVAAIVAFGSLRPTA